MINPKFKLNKVCTSGLLAASCLIGGFASTTSLADSDRSPEVSVELGKTYTYSEDSVEYHTFKPESTGAYLIDLEDNSDDHYIDLIEIDENGDWIFLDNFRDPSHDEDLYCYLEKGKTYMIDHGYDASIPYVFTVNKADFGATSYCYNVSKLGEEATLKVDAISNNDISYTWKDEDGKPLATSSSYSFKADHMHDYNCEVDFGNGLIDNLIVIHSIDTGIVANNIKFNGKTADDFVAYVSKPGEPFELEASADLNGYTGKVSYQWYDNDLNPIEGGNGPKLNVESGIANESMFRCVISDENGNSNESMSMPIWVRVDNGLEVTNCPDENIYLNGATDCTLNIDVSAKDMSGMVYNWIVYGYGESEYAEFKTETPSLKLDNITDTCNVIFSATDKYNNDVYLWFNIHPETKTVEIEAVNAFVERLYTTALGREAEEEGKAYWADQLADQMVSGDFAATFFFLSDELQSQNISNDEYITRLYVTYLNREPDAEGFAYWKENLDNGTFTRETILRGFSVSDEFVTRCNDAGIIAFF